MGPYEDLEVPELDTSGDNQPKEKSAVAAILSLVGTVVASAVSLWNQNSVNRHNQSLAQQQNQWNIDQWNAENAYNSPINQVQRLRAAGLNPGLLMSNGIENVSASSPEMVSSQGQASANFANPFSNFASDLSSMSLLDAQRENIEADTRKKNSEAGFMDLQSADLNVKLDVDKKWLDTLTEDQHRKLTVEIDKLGSELKQITQSIRNLQAEELLTLLEADKVKYYIDNIQPAELERIQSETGLNRAQTTELLTLLPQKLALLQAQTTLAEKQATLTEEQTNLTKEQTADVHQAARLKKLQADFDEKTRNSDEYVQNYLRQFQLDTSNKEIILAVNQSDHQIALGGFGPGAEDSFTGSVYRVLNAIVTTASHILDPIRGVFGASYSNSVHSVSGSK